MISAAIGIIIPFLGTVLGAACVFWLHHNLELNVNRALTGFAAGIMVAASIWSLLLPALEQAADMGRLAFLPAVVGFWLGILFLLLMDHVIPHLHRFSEEAEGPTSTLKRNTMLMLAVTLHNIPEGIAVGVGYAAWLSGNAQITETAALTLALGIAIQNFPEGAIVSMPLCGEGVSRSRAFLFGAASGAVEPAASLVTLFFAALLEPALPVLLSFAAGAMLYVVVEELIPEMSTEPHSNVGVISFAAGFTLMLALDFALG